MSTLSDSERIDSILHALFRLAAGDFTARVEVGEAADRIDALAAGMNMLAEELQARVEAVERSAEELRRQVSERSRQLADALATMSDPAPLPIAVGDTLEDRYYVVRQLGTGAMGAVHEIVRTTDGRRLALKTLHERVDRSTMARFAREAQVATELSHPNLVPVIDLGVTRSGMMYLVMELVDGTTLEDERSHFGKPAWALPLLAQIAKGLGALHEHGIVHRDLKPANILIAWGVPRIADFGIACLRSDPANDAVGTFNVHLQVSPLTQAGMIFGTPAYIAPELTSGARDAQPAADVFSFGVIACEMIAGVQPFAEPPLVAFLNGRSLERVAELPKDGVPAALREILDRCLHIDPTKRPAAEELLAALLR